MEEVGFGPGFDVGDLGHSEAGDDFVGGCVLKERGEREQRVREAAFGMLPFEVFVPREARFQDFDAERQALAGLQLRLVVAEPGRHVGDEVLVAGQVAMSATTG